MVVFPPSGIEKGRRLTQREIYVMLLGRWETLELFLCLLLLNYLQVQAVLMPKWHNLWWHILIPFNTFRDIALILQS